MKAALTPKPSEELCNLLRSTADIFNSRPDLQEEMKGTQGWINATIGFKTSDNKIASTVIIKDGHVRPRNPLGCFLQRLPARLLLVSEPGKQEGGWLCGIKSGKK